MDTNVITPEALKPVPTTEIPTVPKPTTEAPALAQQNLAQPALQAVELSQKEQQAVSGQENLVSKMLSNIEGLSGESAYRTEVTQQSNIGTLRKELGDLNSQILQKQAEIQQDDTKLVAQMRAEERRDTLLPFAQNAQAKLAGDAQIMRALKTSEIGVLNALALGKQGNIELAKSTIDEAVNAKFAPFREQNAIYEAQLKAIEPLLTSAEKKLAVQQQTKVNLAMKEIEKLSEFQKTALNNAIANGAPSTVLDKISKAQSIDQITKLGSGYLVNPTDRLENAIKQAQLNKLRAEATAEDGGKIVTIDGKTYIQKPDGTLTLPTLPGAKEENIVRRTALEEKLGLLNNILTSSGISSRVGTTALARKSTLGEKVKAIVGGAGAGAIVGAPLGGVGALPGAGIGAIGAGAKAFTTGFVDELTGKGQDFAGSVHQMTSAETLDQVLNLKAAGGTLGALNETEGGWLREAATKINDWEIKDDKGRGTGVWNIDEKTFRKEVERLQELTTKALTNAGGRIKTEQEKADEYLDEVNKALLQTNSAYSTAGYNID